MQRDEKTTQTNQLSETYTTKALLTIASFALFLLVQGYFGKVVFERVKGYKQEYRAYPIAYDSLMASRFGLDYILPKYIVGFMKPKKAVLLVPPKDYITKYVKHTSTFSLTNPIYMFYMNTEIRIVHSDSHDYNKANCTILIDQQGQCYPMKITTGQELESVIQLFKSGKAYAPSK
ncbi:MAG: hypothetical protein ABIN80_19170 [Dyadobacter sp.]|uniref:hypothetical protein n=1 Tax=Dyadobacter sp. TaxID=1914288 RepID=UPI00326719B5